MPRAGSLSDRIRFERRVITHNDLNQAVISWEPETVLWAAAPERLSELSCRFTIHYRADLTPASHRIVWENRIWTIASAVHDVRKRTMSIEAEIALIEVTHLQSTETEYIDGVPVIRPRQ